MHKFQPRLHLVVMDSSTPVVITDINQHKHKTWVFSQTVFTAVTAYQNQLVGEHYLRLTNTHYFS